MTTKERVLDYFEKWAGKGDNPSNGCEVAIIFAGTFADQYQIHIDGVLGWVWNIDQKRPDEYFEFAARILRIDNPWRMTSEELPDQDVAVWGAWKDMLVLYETMPCVYRGNGEWASGEDWEGDLAPPDRWMYILSPWQ